MGNGREIAGMRKMSILLTMCVVGTMIGMLQAGAALPGQPTTVARDGDHYWDFEFGGAPAWVGCGGPGGACVYTHMGPGSPPGGSGSLSFDSDGNGSNLSNEGVAALVRFGGTRLDDIIDLSYHSQNRNLSTHATPPYAPPVNTTILEPGDHVELHLNIDPDGDGDYDETIVFDPEENFATQNPSMNPTPVLPADGDANRGWFRWDPLAPSALWYEESTPATTFTWTQYLNDNLGAKLAPGSTSEFHGGGEGRFVHGHVDNYRFGIYPDTRRYDFEAEVTPGADRYHIHDRFTSSPATTYGEPVIVSKQGVTQTTDDSRQADWSPSGSVLVYSSNSENLSPSSPWEDVFRSTSPGVNATVSICDNNVCTVGVQPNDNSYQGATSDGDNVAFRSDASNLVPGDANGVSDIFLRNMTTNDVEMVSVSTAGAPGNKWGNDPSISADGRYVVWLSKADNLVPGDTNDDWDVFLRDTVADTTERILRNDGSQINFNEKDAEISANGDWVTFSSYDNLITGAGNDTNDRRDVFVWNRVTKQSVLVSRNGVTQGNGGSFDPSISDLGDYVAFVTNASNLGGDTDGDTPTIYLVRTDGSMAPERVNVKSDDVTQSNQGAYRPSLGYSSGTTMYIAFESEATNLGYLNDDNQDRDVFVRRLDLGSARPNAGSITVPYTSGNAPAFRADIVASGNLAYEAHATNLLAGDDNHRKDIFFVPVPVNIPTSLP